MMEDNGTDSRERTFPRRPNVDGTYDSICPSCYRTIARGTAEALRFAEESHSCSNEFLLQSLNPFVQGSQVPAPQLLRLAADSETRRTYQSIPSVTTNRSFAVTFSIEKNGDENERYSALFTAPEEFNSAIRDWIAGTDEATFCSRYHLLPK
jgi:hypothetical protein